MHRLFPVLLASLLLLSAGFLYAEENYRHPVKVSRVEFQDSYKAERRFSGRAVSAQRSALAFELPGTVDEVSVETGGKVQRGDSLVKLDTRLLDVQAAEVDAALRENSASLDKARQDLERQTSLQKKGYSAQQAIDDLQAQLKILKAQREKLAAQRRGVELRLEKSVIRAPFDGEVISKSVDTGVTIKEGQPALEIAETGHIEAVFGIPEVMRATVQQGASAKVGGLFGLVQAEVVSVSQTVNPATLTHAVRVRFPDDTDVADGSIVYLYLDQERAQRGFWAPLSALLEGYRGTWAVYALTPENLLEKRSVSVLYQAADRVFLDGELEPGAPIVADGVHRFAAGQKVQVASP